MPASANSRKVRPAKRKTAKAPRRLPRAKAVGSLFVTALDFTDEEAATMLRRMLTIRRLDEALIRLARRNGAPVPPAPGREAIAVGACSVLKPTDFVVGDEWRHGLIIAHAGSARAAVAEWTGPALRVAEASGKEIIEGKGADAPAPADAHAKVLYGGMAVAVGAGLACRWNRQGQVVLCFCSPGDQDKGAFHESLTLCVEWKLPVVYIFPELESTRRPSAARIFLQARHYSVEGALCDGSSVTDVRTAVSSACERARAGKGPMLIEASVPAAKARSATPAVLNTSQAQDGAENGSEEAPAAPESELDIKSLRDPLRIFRNLLAEAALIDDTSVAALEKEVSAEVKAALAKSAEKAPIPAREILLRNVYKGWIEGRYGLMRQP